MKIQISGSRAYPNGRSLAPRPAVGHGHEGLFRVDLSRQIVSRERLESGTERPAASPHTRVRVPRVPCHTDLYGWASPTSSGPCWEARMETALQQFFQV
jgi:hypothetical protein